MRALSLVCAVRAWWSRLRARVYDAAVGRMTTRWYREVLRTCPRRGVLLDVGVGTASSLVANADVLRARELVVVGVDYTPAYVHAAQALLTASRLRDVVTVEHADICAYNTDYARRFDAVYFSGSFMLLPQPVQALQHCVRMLRAHDDNDKGNNSDEANTQHDNEDVRGCVYFTQTFEQRGVLGTYVTPLLKRLLRVLTTIDFGAVTYEDDFRRSLDAAGVAVVRTRVLHASPFRTQMLVVATPRRRCRRGD